MRETTNCTKSANAVDTAKSHNLSFLEERSTMNYNFNYKHLNAKDLFCKIIANEKKVAATDLRSLPLYERCALMYKCVNEEHPELPFSSIDQSILDETKRELELLDSEGDPISRYYLMYVFRIPYTKAESDAVLKAAAEQHYVPLAMKYLSRKLVRGLDESDCEMAESLLEYLYSLEPSDLVSRGIIICHRVLNHFLPADVESFDSIIEAERSRRIELYPSYFQIFSRKITGRANLKSATDDIERADADSALAFWETVDYLLCDYYQRRFGGEWNRRLAPKVFSGKGCEPDVARAVELDTSYMVYERERFPADRIQAILNVAANEEEAAPINAMLLRAFVDYDFTTVRQCIATLHSGGSRDAFNYVRYCLSDAKFLS